MQIPTKMIDAAADAYACGESLFWLRAAPRTFEEMIQHRPDWFAWAVNRLPAYRRTLKKHIPALIQRSNAHATHIAAHLTAVQLNLVARWASTNEETWALIDEKARISRANLKHLYSLSPIAFFCQAPELLKDETLARLALQRPHRACAKAEIWNRLSDEEKAAVLRAMT